jgi:hypothetical protein
MKKQLYATVLLMFAVLISYQTKAQSYQTAIGLKAGAYETGLSVKYFMQKDVALEGILGFRSSGVVITGLYERHLPGALSIDDLTFYYGAGAHIGAIGKGEYQRLGSSSQVYTDNRLLLGADGVIGLEYIIPGAPIAVSLDLNPRLELLTGPFFDIAPGVGVKYTFK